MPDILPAENALTPFMLENGEVRGRVVRLGAVAHKILSQYDYPAPVARVLGEVMAVAAILSSNLKSEGILTVQIRGNGPVPLLVVDAADGGALRGYADLAADAAVRLGTTPGLPDLFGTDAYLAITLDPGEGLQRYQGVVALDGASIGEALQHYFVNSQQLDVNVQLAVADAAPWSVAGFMIERMPEAKIESDSWPYARAVATTVTQAELLDPLLDAPSLLYRLFHEEGVIVYDAKPLRAQCRCSRERMMGLLTSMPLADRADMVVDGAVRVHCQFCNTDQLFMPQDLGLGGVN